MKMRSDQEDKANLRKARRGDTTALYSLLYRNDRLKKMVMYQWRLYCRGLDIPLTQDLPDICSNVLRELLDRTAELPAGFKDFFNLVRDITSYECKEKVQDYSGISLDQISDPDKPMLKLQERIVRGERAFVSITPLPQKKDELYKTYEAKKLGVIKEMSRRSYTSIRRNIPFYRKIIGEETSKWKIPLRNRDRVAKKFLYKFGIKINNAATASKLAKFFRDEREQHRYNINHEELKQVEAMVTKQIEDWEKAGFISDSCASRMKEVFVQKEILPRKGRLLPKKLKISLEKRIDFLRRSSDSYIPFKPQAFSKGRPKDMPFNNLICALYKSLEVLGVQEEDEWRSAVEKDKWDFIIMTLYFFAIKKIYKGQPVLTFPIGKCENVDGRDINFYPINLSSPNEYALFKDKYFRRIKERYKTHCPNRFS